MTRWELSVSRKWVVAFVVTLGGASWNDAWMDLSIVSENKAAIDYAPLGSRESIGVQVYLFWSPSE
jgi:hypothetical protein